LVAGGWMCGVVRLACLCCRSDCRECGKNGHSERAIREDRRGSIQYGRREYLPAVPWEGRYRRYAGWGGRPAASQDVARVSVPGWGRRLEGEQRTISRGH